MNGSRHSASTVSRRLIEIGVALSSEKNPDELLEKIVSYARELTTADAGTLYLLHQDQLHFKIMQTQSLGIRHRWSTTAATHMKPLPLDRALVAAYTALEGKTVRIEDVYESELFDFSGPRRYDAVTGYHSRSMLVVPMKDHDDEVIGVLQLVNATDPETGVVGVFTSDDAELTEALASQAAVAIENLTLINDLRELFESLVTMLAVAIDAKTPYTTNHIQRVALLNLFIAEKIHHATDAPFAQTRFSETEMDALRLAGWLHDVGKVTTPVNIINKATKLETVFNRVEMIRERFELIKLALEREAIDRWLRRDKDTSLEEVLQADSGHTRSVNELNELFKFVDHCNQPSEFMPDEDLDRLREIAGRYFSISGSSRPYISSDELYNLSTRRGSLTSEELDIMREHVVWTERMLNEIPFRGKLADVPRYAIQHHEKPNGHGYPYGLKGDEIPFPSRILAVADLYEALSAPDRPYKKRIPLPEIHRIMRAAADNGDVDGDIVEFCLSHNVFEQFEEETVE